MAILRNRPLGIVAALFTVAIWAAFLVGTRYAVSGNFTVEEVLILRLLPAAILMFPFMLKLGVFPRSIGWVEAFFIMFGASAISLSLFLRVYSLHLPLMLVHLLLVCCLFGLP